MNILNTIDSILKEDGHFECKSNRILIEELNKEKNGKRFLDCDDYSSIYLAAAEQLGLPLESVYFPAHVFLRCQLSNSRNFYWEPTIAAETNMSYYKKRLNIPENSFYPKILNEKQFEAIKLCDLGTAWFKKEDYLRAIGYFQKALESNSEFAPAFNNLGAAYAKQGHYGKALECYREALAVNHNYGAALCNIGVAYYRLENLKKAIKYFDKSLKLNPRNKKTSRYKFRALIEKGQSNKASRYIAKFNRKLE